MEPKFFRTNIFLVYDFVGIKIILEPEIFRTKNFSEPKFLDPKFEWVCFPMSSNPNLFHLKERVSTSRKVRVSERCLIGVLKLAGRCLIGALKVSGMLLAFVQQAALHNLERTFTWNWSLTQLSPACFVYFYMKSPLNFGISANWNVLIYFQLSKEPNFYKIS